MILKNYIHSLQTVFDKINSPVCFVNINGDILYSNTVFSEDKGEEYLKTFLEHNPIDESRVNELLALANSANSNSFSEINNNDYNVNVNAVKFEDASPHLLIQFLQKKHTTTESELFKQILDNIPDHVYVKDKSCRYILVNKCAAQMLGTKNINEIVGKSDFDFLPTQIARKFYNDDKDILKSGHSLINIEEEVITKNGETKWFSSTKVPVIQNNEAVGIVGISRDITTQKQEKEALKRAKKQAELTDQLKSAFLANMSHELRTPLNGILGFAQFLRQANTPAEKRNKYLDIIFFNGKHLLTLINNVIDIAKIDAGEIFISKSLFSINELLDDNFNNFKNLLANKQKTKIELHLEKGLSNDESQIFTDKNRVGQILDNLLNNAMKFTNQGKISFGYRVYNDDKLIFYVSDTGIGISEEKQDIIFSKFRQADDSLTRKHGGTGLGLSIVKGLVEILGGEIWFESKANIGSSFYFTLPFTQSKQDDNPIITDQLSENWKNKKILVVEDDLMSFRFLEMIFKKQFINVSHASNGPDALDMFNKEDFQVVLMDIKLPGMNGLTVTQKIKAIKPELPVIALTAFAYDNDNEDCLNAGCDFYLTKPVDKVNLYKILNELIDKKP